MPNNLDTFVTSEAVVSPFGEGVSVLWDSICSGHLGLTSIKGWFVPDDFPVNFAGVLPFNFIEKGIPYSSQTKRGEVRYWDLIDKLFSQMEEQLKNVSNLDAIIFVHGRMKLGNSVPSYLFSHREEGHKLNTPSVSIESIFFQNLKKRKIQVNDGAVWFVNNACAGSVVGLGFAFQQIRSKKWHRALVCSINLLDEPLLIRFNSLGVLANDCTDVNMLSRPFSKDRGGFVASEGAAMVLLESSDAILESQNLPFYKISGFGQSSDGSDLVSGREDCGGIIDAIKFCIFDSGLKLSEIDIIKAHGTATPLNDLHEAKAIESIFHSQGVDPPVFSLKGQLGHSLNASGLVELMVCSRMIKSQMRVQSYNYSPIDPLVNINIVKTTERNIKINNVLVNSFGFGGNNACLMISKA